jgi:rsbT co-antagonist protein RsbR
MSLKTYQLLQKKKNNILELWMKNQLADEGLREDLISNDELRSQSEELINALVANLSGENFTNLESDEWSWVV